MTAAVAAMIACGPALAGRQSTQSVAPVEPILNGRAVVAVVSIKDQRISLYDGTGGVVRARISSGQTGYETPVGVFSVLQKEVEHHSNLYDDASMPFMQRLTWSGIAMHAGVLPGHPASHGCVRLPHDFAQQIFRMTKLGMRVVLSRDDIAPVEIAHALLPKPEPVAETVVATPATYSSSSYDEERATVTDPEVRNWPARQRLLDTLRAESKVKAEQAKTAVTAWEALKAGLKKYSKELALVAKRDQAASAKRKAEERVAKADKALAGAKVPRAQKRAEKEKSDATAALAKADAKLVEATSAAVEAEKVLAEINAGIAAEEARKTAAVAAAAEARRKTLPISIFVSAKSQKLYVRQGNEPVFDAKVTVADPSRPVGTHVFTALDYAGDGNAVRWNVVTISQRTLGTGDYAELDHGRGKKRSDDSGYAPPITDAAGAAAALDRVSIPEDVKARISQYVWPRSSFIISDEALSKETGKGTDFIVVASNEAQGALKIRKRQPPPTTYRTYYDDNYYYYGSPSGYRNDRRYQPPRYYNKSPFGWW